MNFSEHEFPGDLEIRQLIKEANLAYDFSRWAEAYQLYKRIETLASALPPSLSAPPPPNLGHVFYRLGMIHYVNSSHLSELEGVQDLPGVARAYFGKAFVALREVADAGDAEAQADLGYMYYNGHAEGGTDHALALKYYHMAGEQGYSRALCNLGYIYYNSSKDSERKLAIEYYQKAASCGSLVAHSNLGFIYKDPEGLLPQNYTLAVNHFFIAAKGNEKARNHLEAVFNNEYGDDYRRVAQGSLAASWRPQFRLLHPDCRAAICELFCWTQPNTLRAPQDAERRGLLVELVELICFYVIVVFPKNHFKGEV
eukprot:TRINITY_DN4426_c0_g1_i1.p1 TRINITY_DN4426_c0_g1~~TRINITY_DN4426_c0_g1_i1.p1  ORF type:complete len:312 (-),score=38.95 TRINITY_DN4426_c0_g1_i1:107-1042(-)